MIVYYSTRKRYSEIAGMQIEDVQEGKVMFDNAETKKIVVVGGVAGGMSAAARARRLSEKSEIVVFERSGHVSFANCGLPYVLGKEIAEKEELVVQTPSSLKDLLNLDVRINSEVIDIDLAAMTVKVKDLSSSNIYDESFDELVLSVGASPVRPPLPGIDLPGIFTLRAIEDLDRLDSWFEIKHPRNAVVVGGGLIGLEVAEQLLRRGLTVTIVEGQDQVLPPCDPEFARLAEQELQKHGIKLVLNSFIKEFKAPSGLNGPKSCFVVAGEQEPLAADLVILGLGVRPEVALARKAGIAVGQRGGIAVDQFLHTNVPGVWAIGDAIEVVQPLNQQKTLAPLGGPANRQGRIVADNIFGKARPYEGTIGTAIVRVFDLTIGMTGLSEKLLKASSLPYEKAYLHPLHHAGYYPGAERLDIKILFHKENHRILGAQIAGKEGVDKRADVLATAIKGHLTVHDLAELELSYAPPFGSAKDPINLSGMIGVNAIDGVNVQCEWQEIPALAAGTYCLLDVRGEGERRRGFVPDSIHIPMPELRKRLAELPAGKTIYVYCQTGKLSYFASRMLSQAGFTARNLSGGYLTWLALTGNPCMQAELGVSATACCNQSGSMAAQDQISVEGLRSLNTAGAKLTVIDVRSAAEFNAENIPGSINVPLAEIPDSVDRSNWQEPIVIVCRGGLRAPRAAAILKGSSYKDVRVLSGGVLSWRKAGYPVNKGRECLPVERQTQLVIGFMVITTILLGVFQNPLFFLITGFMGAGIMFAGATGTCGLALLIAKAPWNAAGEGTATAGVPQSAGYSSSCCR
jgi:NADPH-dependent 2,4-dienoyl-CoA reductase/sulfur reductase-like enzyme/rhodanese-related sulfurtransferase